MAKSVTTRKVLFNVHLWIGLALALLIMPVSLSGALLVWHDEIDTLINRHRYAVTGAAMQLPASDYLANAAQAVGADYQVTVLRYPQSGGPVQVGTRSANTPQGTRPRIVTVYLDPPTGNVLDTQDFRASFFGFLHVFHENLTIPEYSGRQVVGWVGVGMLILSLSGIYLWWPRNGGFRLGLRWRRAPQTSTNLHHILGFWISIPLALVSLTGIYLAFPQTAREFMSSVATMSPQGPRPGFGPVMRNPQLNAERAVEAARLAAPEATPVAVFLPTASRDPAQAPTWRVQLRLPGDSAIRNISVDDRTGTAGSMSTPQSGDRAASWIRWIHEGSHSGPVWQGIVFLTGAFPLIFVVTGVMMWLRGRSAKATRRRARRQLRPAE